MTCLCCGSEDTAGLPRMAVLCWTCAAEFRAVSESVEMISCMCGRHDDGKIIKSATREETKEL